MSGSQRPGDGVLLDLLQGHSLCIIVLCMHQEVEQKMSHLFLQNLQISEVGRSELETSLLRLMVYINVPTLWLHINSSYIMHLGLKM
jgi:hypothetical protein